MADPISIDPNPSPRSSNVSNVNFKRDFCETCHHECSKNSKIEDSGGEHWLERERKRNNESKFRLQFFYIWDEKFCKNILFCKRL